MILGVLALLVANAATLLGAHELMHRVRTGKAPVDQLLFLLLRLLLISSAVLGMGSLGLLNPIAMSALAVVVLVLLISTGAHRRLPKGSPSITLWSLLAGVILLRLLLQVWFFAPCLEDSRAYHLPKLAEWIRAGGFSADLGADPRSTFPAGFELIETWWVLFLHHDVLVEMAGVEFLIVAAAALRALAFGFGWSERSGRIAALAFILGPGLYFQATSCINDGAVAGLLAASLALIVSGASLPLILVPVLLGVGVKPTFILALPGLVLIAGLFAGREEPSCRKLPLGLAAAALVSGAWWYARNWIQYGNPIHPMGRGGMSSLVTGGTLQRVGPSLRSLQDNLTAFFDLRIYDRLFPPDGNCTLGFNGGAAAFALGFPALLLLLRSEPLLRRVAAGIAVSVLCVFSCVELDPWNNRFILILGALPALALARLWERHRVVAVLGSLALSLQFLSTFLPGALPAEDFSRMAKQGWADRAYHPAPAGDAPVGWLCDDFGTPYDLYGPDLLRRVVYLRESTERDLLQRVDHENVRAIYVAGSLSRRGPLLEEAVRNGRLRPFDVDGWKGYTVLPPR